MRFEQNMESAKEHEVPAIAKINRLMSQISTNLASTLYDTSQMQDKGISIKIIRIL